MAIDIIATIAVALAVAVAIAITTLARGPRTSRWWAVIAPIAVTALGTLVVEWPGTGAVVESGAPPFGAIVAIGVAVLGVVAGSPLVALVLEWSSPSTRAAPGTHGGILVPDLRAPAPEQSANERAVDERPVDKAVLRGGTTIGYLERLAVVGSILAGQLAAVAIVVAVKALGRFSELDSAEARERFIIGTLASLTWAALCSLTATAWW